MPEKWGYWESDFGYLFRPTRERTQQELENEFGKNPKLLWEIEAETEEEVCKLHYEKLKEVVEEERSKRHEWFQDGGLPAIVTFRPHICPDCLKCHKPKDEDPNNIFNVIITTIKSVKDGWVTEGKGLLTHAKSNNYAPVTCFTCGCAFSALVNILPIECKQFTCPKCGDNKDMDFKVSKIERKDTGFDFEASVTCKTCNNINRFSKFIAKLFDLIKIEIGPSGVILKKG